LNILDNAIFNGNVNISGGANIGGTLKVDGPASFGAGALSVNSNGTVGIGTTAADDTLTVDNQNSTSTFELGGAYQSCLKLRDSDNAGWTYCTGAKRIINLQSNSLRPIIF